MRTINNRTFTETESIDLTIGSFTISTLFFVFYILSNGSTTLLVVASPFAFSALIVNAIMLFHLTDKFIQLSEQRKDIGIKILILLSNIPILFLYYSIAIRV
jgi:hypothetical protein